MENYFNASVTNIDYICFTVNKFNLYFVQGQQYEILYLWEKVLSRE